MWLKLNPKVVADSTLSISKMMKWWNDENKNFIYILQGLDFQHQRYVWDFVRMYPGHCTWPTATHLCDTHFFWRTSHLLRIKMFKILLPSLFNVPASLYQYSYFSCHFIIWQCPRSALKCWLPIFPLITESMVLDGNGNGNTLGALRKATVWHLQRWEVLSDILPFVCQGNDVYSWYASTVRVASFIIYISSQALG